MEGYQPASAEESAVPEISSTPGLLQRCWACGCLTGRDFVPLDSKQGGVIVNRAFVRKYFRGPQSPRQARPELGQQESRSRSWVWFRTSSSGAFAIRRARSSISRSLYPGEVAIFARTRLNPETLLPTLKRIAEREAPGVPVYEATTMDAAVSGTLHQETLLTALAACFGLLAHPAGGHRALRPGSVLGRPPRHA